MPPRLDEVDQEETAHQDPHRHRHQKPRRHEIRQCAHDEPRDDRSGHLGEEHRRRFGRGEAFFTQDGDLMEVQCRDEHCRDRYRQIQQPEPDLSERISPRSRFGGS